MYTSILNVYLHIECIPKGPWVTTSVTDNLRKKEEVGLHLYFNLAVVVVDWAVTDEILIRIIISPLVKRSYNCWGSARSGGIKNCHIWMLGECWPTQSDTMWTCLNQCFLDRSYLDDPVQYHVNTSQAVFLWTDRWSYLTDQVQYHVNKPQSEFCETIKLGWPNPIQYEHLLN